MEKYFLVNTTQNLLLTASDAPLLTVRPLGLGYTVFMGLNPDPAYSNFHLSSSYPILVSQLMSFLSTGGVKAQNNLQTGQTLLFEKQRQILTPSENKLNTSYIVLDEVGFYETPRIYSASLIDPGESDLNPKNLSGVEDESRFDASLEQVEVERDLRLPAIILVLIIILVEAAAYKMRGVI
ncbi:MAG: hypothetical protein GF334_01985 [Candidatus Altiarchaeales archaeon]|nr:hypothetical protein [Candidatus Altiarchaeales archaeon]